MMTLKNLFLTPSSLDSSSLLQGARLLEKMFGRSCKPFAGVQVANTICKFEMSPLAFPSGP
jgi:hypothetical protein